MDRFRIQGGSPLRGTVRTSGAKNAALPCLAASLLTEEPVILRNLPSVRDIRTTCQVLKSLGVAVIEDADSWSWPPSDSRHLKVHAAAISTMEVPWELMRTMRASSLILGPLAARTGEARVALPGGCAIGARPIDLHIKGLEKLGAEITTEHGMVIARAKRLRGGHIYFERITVTGTEDLLMAATLADGETVLDNAACEPEVEDLANLLISMGAKIEGAGTSTIRIQGVAKLHGADHTIIPDRIEAGTFLAAAGITGGDITVENCAPQHLTAVMEKFRQAGMKIEMPTPNTLRAKAPGSPGKLQASDMTTAEHPGFPTDMQAQYMALATQAEGISVITENIFENRFMHAPELTRMGADIRIEGNLAVVRGKTKLSGAGITASDLRASASLVIAALAAEGESMLERVYHIDRGYERIETKLNLLGARITREPSE
jgi:UDP-N-acetylglucosamine 1-carboxyvinyltransferase